MHGYDPARIGLSVARAKSLVTKLDKNGDLGVPSDWLFEGVSGQARLEQGALPGIDEVMSNQPLQGVCRVSVEPGFAGTESEAITPVIHIGEHAFPPEFVDFVGKQDLQVTNRVFFRLVAAGIGIEQLASGRIQTQKVAGFVQDGM